MSLNAQDNQAEKPRVTAPQIRAHSPPADQSKPSGGARREKKQTHQGRQEHREASPATSQEDVSKTDASETNATQDGEA